MAQQPAELTPLASARHFFGAQLRYWRQRRGLSLARLGEAVYASAALVGKAEKAQRWLSPALVQACEAVLDSGGVLPQLYALAADERPTLASRHRSESTQAPQRRWWRDTWPMAWRAVEQGRRLNGTWEQSVAVRTHCVCLPRLSTDPSVSDRHVGTGFKVRLDDPHAELNTLVTGFILDLTRAPALRYQRDTTAASERWTTLDLVDSSVFILGAIRSGFAPPRHRLDSHPTFSTPANDSCPTSASYSAAAHLTDLERTRAEHESLGL